MKSDITRLQPELDTQQTWLGEARIKANAHRDVKRQSHSSVVGGTGTGNAHAGTAAACAIERSSSIKTETLKVPKDHAPKNWHSSRFLAFEQALVYARCLGLHDKEDWQRMCMSGALPANVPSHPDYAYKHDGWQGWEHWMRAGTAKQHHAMQQAMQHTAMSQMMSPEHAGTAHPSDTLRHNILQHTMQHHHRPQQQGLARGTRAGWPSAWLATHPAQPRQRDALEPPSKATPKPNVCHRKFLPFEKALAHARALKLTGSSEWREWAKSGARPANIPAAPGQAYRFDGWEGYGHWLHAQPSPLAADSDRGAATRLLGPHATRPLGVTESTAPSWAPTPNPIADTTHKNVRAARGHGVPAAMPGNHFGKAIVQKQPWPQARTPPPQPMARMLAAGPVVQLAQTARQRTEGTQHIVPAMQQYAMPKKFLSWEEPRNAFAARPQLTVTVKQEAGVDTWPGTAYLPATPPSPIFPVLLPHFRLCGVVSIYMCVLPYKYRKILAMLLKLTKLCDIMGRRRTYLRLNESLGAAYAINEPLGAAYVINESLGAGAGAGAGIVAYAYGTTPHTKKGG